MDSMIQDVKFALRVIIRKPAFSAVACLCLALGIGLNTATFSLINAFLLRPLPVEAPDRLVRVFTSLSSDFLYASVSFLDYQDYRQEGEIFDGLVAQRPFPISVAQAGEAELASGALVSGNYFDVLGVPMQVGRSFAADEDRTPGSHPVAVLAHGFWQRRFGEDPSIVGSGVVVNGHEFQVIGVARKGFTGTLPPLAFDMYIPLAMQAQVAAGMSSQTSRGNHYLTVTGRLRGGIDVSQAQEAARLVGKRLAEQYPATNASSSPLLVPESEMTVPPQFRNAAIGFSGLVMAAVGLVLLIACANVANLLMARANARRREISLRLAVGASRMRLVRQLLTESLLLAALGGVMGLGLAQIATGLLASLTPPLGIPVHFDFSPDIRVLGFTLVAVLVTGLLFGLAPALQASRTNLVPALKGESLTSGKGPFSMANVMVVGQVALCLVLLIGAGLFIRSLDEANQIDPGFLTDSILMASLDPSLNGYSEAAGEDLFNQLLERVKNLPGVQKAALGEMVSFSFGGQQNGIEVPGYAPSEQESMSIDYNVVSPEYFETLGIPIVTGRAFASQDDENGLPVVIVNQVFVDRYFGGRDPIGQTINARGRRQVVGVAANIKLSTLGEAPKPYFYTPFSQDYQSRMLLHLRASGNPSELAPQVRAELSALDQNVPILLMQTMRDQLGVSLLAARTGATVLSTFAVMALILSSVGLYGILVFWVSQRTPEIGIRIALGAARGTVLRMVLARGLALAGIGIVIGLPASLALSRLTAGFLYGSAATDLTTFIGVPLLLLGVVLTACLIPARRALRIDPIRALRYE